MDHQRESKEPSQADQAGEVRFGGFGLLSGQNGPPGREQGAQPSRPSWRGPFWRIWAAKWTKRSTRERKGQRPMRLEEQGGPCWRIWAAERPKRTTRRRARSTAQQTKLARSGEARFGGFGLLSGQNGPPEGEQGAQPSRPTWRGPFWRIWAKRTSTAKQTKLARSVLEDLGCWAAKTDHQREPAKQTLLARSVLEDLGCWSAKTDHQRESKEHSQADQHGEVRFGGFGLLSGQNGPPEGEQGAQPSRPSWRGPFWSIWAAERPKWTIRGRARSLAKLTKLARFVLEDLGCWAAKTDHQGESKEHTQADQAGEVRFGGFGPLSGQNGAPGRERDRDRWGWKSREVRVDGFGLLSGQNGPPDEEQGAQPSRPSWRDLARPVLEDLGCWAAKRTTRGRARSSAKQTNMARSVLGDLGKTDHQGRARSTAKQTKLARSVLEDLGCWAAKTDHQREPANQTLLARSVLEDLGCWAAKTDHQRESKEHSQADQAGDDQQNGAPGRDRERELCLFHRPHWTQRLYLCLLSLFLAVCLWWLLSVRSCLDIPVFCQKFADHFLYARDV